MKMNRNLDGAYFRIERNGKWESICFTDLTMEERNKVMEKNKDVQWLMSMCNYLADTIREIGDALNIFGGR